ncbi:MAG: NAD(+) kinase [Campylobacter sp.]|nr:NAD(+) kinase [Campylobacter sp.]
MKTKSLDYQNLKFVGLVAKKSKDFEQNFKILTEIFNSRGIEILLAKDDKSLDEITKKTDFIICLGGDGTLISTCRKTAATQPFVFGIHAGRLGFLTDITINEAKDFFDEFFKGNFTVEEPFMLDIFLNKKDGTKILKIAFNDAVIMRSKPVSIASVDAFVNGKMFNSYFGDGLIASTPVGSSAYNMSAGGAIIYPLSDVFTLTPICSHSLTQRPIVLPKDFCVELRAKNDEVLVIDGQDSFYMNEYESVGIKLSDKFARLVRHTGRDYFQILKEKLRWGH